MIRDNTAARAERTTCPIIASTATIGVDCIFVTRTPHAQRHMKTRRLRYFLYRSAGPRNTRKPYSLKMSDAMSSLFRRRVARRRTNQPSAARAAAESANDSLSLEDTIGGMMAGLVTPYKVCDAVDNNGKTTLGRQSVSRG